MNKVHVNDYVKFSFTSSVDYQNMENNMSGSPSDIEREVLIRLREIYISNPNKFKDSKMVQAFRISDLIKEAYEHDKKLFRNLLKQCYEEVYFTPNILKNIEGLTDFLGYDTESSKIKEIVKHRKEQRGIFKKYYVDVEYYEPNPEYEKLKNIFEEEKCFVINVIVTYNREYSEEDYSTFYDEYITYWDVLTKDAEIKEIVYTYDGFTGYGGMERGRVRNSFSNLKVSSQNTMLFEEYRTILSLELAYAFVSFLGEERFKQIYKNTI